jgi:hypothetical protein
MLFLPMPLLPLLNTNDYLRVKCQPGQKPLKYKMPELHKIFPLLVDFIPYFTIIISEFFLVQCS